MILTVTPNPAIDRAIFVRGFCMGQKTRALSEATAPAGKGVGVSLVVRELGGDTLATGLCAGRNGQRLHQMLAALGIRHDFVDAEGATRASVVLVDLDTHRQSTISLPSLRASPSHVDRLLDVLKLHAPYAWGAVFGGSLPPGLPAQAYEILVRWARELGLWVLLDTSGEPLRRGIAGLPHVLKVNLEELSGLEPSVAAQLGSGETTFEGSGLRLRNRIGEWASEAVIVTRGHHGALAVTAETTLVARPPQVPVVNTAGAGDALTGGLMLARSRGASWCDALALGTAAAASVVTTEGTGICLSDQVAELLPTITVESLPY
jgi:1-phosphofructokinase family hexose kinase